MKIQEELESLILLLDSNKIVSTFTFDKVISPYQWLNIPEYAVSIHYICPSEKTKHWHSPTSLIDFPPTLNGNHIIHLWQDTWLNHKAACISRIMGALGRSEVIYARKLTTKRIDIHTLNDFLKENHTNLPTTAKIKFGLYLENELYAVASFSGKRKMNNRDGLVHQSYELIRYCNKNGTTVIGGLGKLLKHFIVEYSPDDIMTYTDSDWSNGISFEKLGFKLLEQTTAFTFYWNCNEKCKFTKEEMGDFPIYNNGSNKFILNLNTINV
ncbi:hypothetical protein [Flammeovirga kamogawensis]|uniref:GNAT family N-acetyltransferase n=1 Tax=Flammeovirga kamogawensis TaxID=373891 RepID=A0ABX8GVQ9_9BACT|nr:hypothetical protein [Flammeovirga kamogawensis]MBB6461662.1 hypothetical protein [Flammeovirga kamogawensis]QWG07412.1 hypothetical protein KM029_00265 [Flammeovirga kamogawensis]TRX69223.1 hypothetical protein EO216_14210 [Flammeovirga kamogawensis]